MWYGVYHQPSHQLTYASAAHPPAFMMTGDSHEQVELVELTTGNMAIGFMEDNAFKQASLNLKKFNKLYVYSDGVYEIEKPDGNMVTLAEYTEIIRKLSDFKQPQVEHVLKTMRALQGNDAPFEDDFSFVELIINRE